ncbi:hypothetical protein A6A26_24280 (plasmid) [Pantoea sp. OXWO6B1]|nr:hypothetical protein A6A26_24280 [Pantoea sp. OXWO6B1]
MNSRSANWFPEIRIWKQDDSKIAASLLQFFLISYQQATSILCSKIAAILLQHKINKTMPNE